MSLEFFISRKILKNEVQGKKVSKAIVRISVISIALTIVVNLITLAVVRGFKQEVRQKVAGFGSHLVIMKSGEVSVQETSPIRANSELLTRLKKNDKIASIHPVAYKPVLFQSEKVERHYKIHGRDTSEIQQEIHASLLKGVDSTYPWEFFKSNLKEGKLPNFNSKAASFEILISKHLAQTLHYSVGDTIRSFFVKQTPIMRQFVVCGIYATGLEDHDKKLALVDIRHVQELNDWGIKASIELIDTMYKDHLILNAVANGGNGNYRFNWGQGFRPNSGIAIYPLKDTAFQVTVSDYWNNLDGNDEVTSIADTAFVTLKIKGKAYSYCDFALNSDKELIRDYRDETGNNFSLHASEKEVFFKIQNGRGSHPNYVGAYEVNVKDWSNLALVQKELKKQVEFIPTQFGESLMVQSLIQSEAEIFTWLDFLDLNVAIVLILMILIGIINMGSALLVLILVRTNFIGVLKALGASNLLIRKVFLYQAGFLILRGMLIGNIIGLIFVFVQQKYSVLSLNPEVYYLDKVPVSLHPMHWLLLNLGTLVVCLTALIVPSLVIARISPARSIKFN